MFKLFPSFIAITLMISPLSVLAQNAGDLIKCPDFSSVYYLAENDKRYVFPNEKIYFSWYNDFARQVGYENAVRVFGRGE